jgi:hypothetical protein
MIGLIEELKSLGRDVAWLKRAVQALLDQQGISPAQELAEAAGRQGVRPLRSAEDLIQPGMFDSYEQMDEFLAELRALGLAERREATGDA